MAPRKEKKTGDSINSRLALVIKSGKGTFSIRYRLPGSQLTGEVTLGYKSSLKMLRMGKAKLVLIAGNTPPLRKSELECKFSLHVPCHTFTMSNKTQTMLCSRRALFITSTVITYVLNFLSPQDVTPHTRLSLVADGISFQDTTENASALVDSITPMINTIFGAQR
jgi:large subunit ribosomal protein L30e